jgi:hypothetical protein
LCASDVQIAEPTVPPCERSTMEKLAKEKEVVGLYFRASLDDFKFEMKYFVMLN